MIYIILGVLLIVSGGFGASWVNARKFKRTNPHGVQVFASYPALIMARGAESLVTMLSYAAIVGGGVAIFYQFF